MNEKAITEDKDLEVIDQFVDQLASSGPEPNENDSKTLETIFENNTEAQERFIKSLVYKLISFTYNLGSKPVSECSNVIENATKFQTIFHHGENISAKLSNESQTSQSNDNKVKAENEILRRRKSCENKTHVQRKSIVSGSLTSSPQNQRIKKQSSLKLDFDTESSNKKVIRNILYSLAYMRVAYDDSKWNFQCLRELFLLWNKTRGWSDQPTKFETTVLKLLSQAPKAVSLKDRWIEIFEKFLGHFSPSKLSHEDGLDDHTVINGMVYWVTKKRAAKELAIKDKIVCILSLAEKIFISWQFYKLLPLLHVFRETLITADYIPLEILQQSYSTFLRFYIWPTTFSSAVKDTLDIIQTEMKSPGYYFRILYLQEHDFSRLFEKIELVTTRSFLNIYLDKDVKLTKKLAPIYEKVFESSLQNDSENLEKKTCYLLLQMFHSTFGPEDCDLDLLSNIIQKCPNNLINSLCAESLYIMDESAKMESHQAAQTFIREKLESISMKLIKETEKHFSKKAKQHRLTVIVQPASLPIPSDPISSSSLQDGSSFKRLTSQDFSHSDGYKSISYNLDIKIKEFDFNRFQIEIFELLRSSAKSYMEEKRNTVRHNSCDNDVRDSGVIDDDETSYSFATDKSDKDVTSEKKDEKEVEEMWQSFSTNGFSDDKDNAILDNLLKSMSLDSCISNRSSLKSNFGADDYEDSCDIDSKFQKNLEQISNTEDVNEFVEKVKPNYEPPKDRNKKRKNFKEYKNRIKTIGRKGLGKMMTSIRKDPSAIGLDSAFNTTVCDFTQGSQSQNTSPFHDCNKLHPDINVGFDDLELRTWAKYCKNRKITNIRSPFENDQGPSSARSSFSVASVPEDSYDTNSKSRIRVDSGIVTDREDLELMSIKRSRSSPFPSFFQMRSEVYLSGIGKWQTKQNHEDEESKEVNLHRKQLLKLVVVGNDTTIGQVARSYYYLRQQQASRSPMLNYVDLKIYYIPIGNCMHLDESEKKSEAFDLRYANVISKVDSWHYLVNAMAVISLLRLHKNQKKVDTEEPITAIEKMIASSLISYSRFAINTFNVPLFKVVIETSTPETIKEVMAIGVDIGSFAYMKAVESGKFGKLVDLSENARPPETLSTIEFTKVGSFGNIISSELLDPVFYDYVEIEPEILNITSSSCGYQNTENLAIYTSEFDKKSKGKRAFRRRVDMNESQHQINLINQVKLQVTSPPQGTLTICIDNKIIHTNVKSVSVSRCLRPDQEKGVHGEGSNLASDDLFLNLPVNIYWPEQF